MRPHTLRSRSRLVPPTTSRQLTARSDYLTIDDVSADSGSVTAEWTFTSPALADDYDVYATLSAADFTTEPDSFEETLRIGFENSESFSHTFDYELGDTDEALLTVYVMNPDDEVIDEVQTRFDVYPDHYDEASIYNIQTSTSPGALDVEWTFLPTATDDYEVVATLSDFDADPPTFTESVALSADDSSDHSHTFEFDISSDQEALLTLYAVGADGDGLIAAETQERPTLEASEDDSDGGGGGGDTDSGVEILGCEIGPSTLSDGDDLEVEIEYTNHDDDAIDFAVEVMVGSSVVYTYETRAMSANNTPDTFTIPFDDLYDEVGAGSYSVEVSEAIY